MSEQLSFIDLFAGLGGFHLALHRLNHQCVFASEIDHQLRDLYERNFQLVPNGDIRKIDVSDIPHHDILCAGFPCQPFSKAGGQSGLDDPRWGDLFFHILRIIRQVKPRFLMLENVPNFERHDKGKTWMQVESLLRAEGYDIRWAKLSPHRFGIPQIRERIFIVGDRQGLQDFEWPIESMESPDLGKILDVNPPESRKLSDQILKCIDTWQEFLDRFPSDEQLPSFPIWGMEFGATYPFEGKTPFGVGVEDLQHYLGSHGQPLSHLDEATLFTALPSYARSRALMFPRWKQTFIRQNRQLYSRHKAWIDDWRPKLLDFPPSLQKFEWNAKGEVRTLRDKVLQVRASGLRAKRPTTAPSLIAMTTTQVPIITWENRYMTPHECARLQSMQLLELPDTPTSAFTALGNAVNVQVVELIARKLLADRSQESVSTNSKYVQGVTQIAKIFETSPKASIVQDLNTPRTIDMEGFIHG